MRSVHQLFIPWTPEEINEPAAEKDSESIRPFQCSTCGMAFAEAFNLRKHIDGVHLYMRSHVCDKCGQGFYKQSALSNHQSNQCQRPKKGQQQKTAEKSPKKQKHEPTAAEYKCPNCPNVYKYRKGLNRHINKAHVVKDPRFG